MSTSPIRWLSLLALVSSTACSSHPGPSPVDVSNGPASSGTVGTSTARASAAPDAQPDPPGAQALFVAPQTVDCQGEGPMKCLRVRDSASDEWRLFYGSIAGFEHEVGNAYELRVTVEARKNPPADASSLKYALVRVVSKTPAP